MTKERMEQLREQIDEINFKILELMNERGYLAKEIGELKKSQGMNRYDPVRERKMLDRLIQHNDGPFDDATIEHIFKEIFKASLELQEIEQQKTLLVSRKNKKENTVINIKGENIGDENPHFIFGPCSVESYEQTRAVAKSVKEKGLKLFRGGAFKPRTSPYDFQGLGWDGLKILKEIAEEFDLAVVSEIVHPSHIERALDYVDVIQIGARNMQNFELLKEAGRVKKPVLLKRGMSATIEEFMLAAEYIVSQGNEEIILCERGIRTYERATRNTLDITSVPILKKETHLPVIVDVTHSTGRRDLLLPAAKAALAIGADGIMAEVHPDPAVALSDARQQMDLGQFDMFFKEIVEK
ncbi:bifunctional 3-deoxy-7-phosphoheptulonate synthase/chorismate mutase [Fervidibacillus halotolerans]|uniref:Bifunctional 3-deoxy-7-phosphoheptulonate synthase/chorismate mutase n=1 Tax=Fervidibacillus halotolerans TaxID=2980027 RepID=A0A9E8LXV1_9BACI|nr:bifunctional 3-deoxy-7-phosphoheptulonate synthase/chorismate mutase [Fervidibacillus halotolerans]WAA11738.1 bifunctional 3-deoxy-7-phosphoheptulonate synthase/chorismate mutase [Fervidibacillus halotolerans]